MKTHGIFICERMFLDGYINMREQFNINIKTNDIEENTKHIKENIKTKAVNKTGFYKEEQNGNGHIYVNGPLSDNGPDGWDMFMGYGGTSYKDIINAIDDFELQGIKTTYIHYNTPGGEVGIVDSVWSKIKKSKMKIISIADGMIASGGYYLASAGDEIISNSPGFEIGSIGVIVSTYSMKEFLEKNGIKAITIRSENATRKVPDIETEEGQAEYLDRINATERLFYKRISIGRGISENRAKKTYGNGAVFPSQDVDNEKPSALKIGMIDSVVNGFRVTKKGQEEMLTQKNEEDKNETTASIDAVEVKHETAIKEVEDKKDFSFAANINKSDSYPQPIKNLALDVIIGNATEDALRASVAAFDATKALQKVNESMEEENEIASQSRNESTYNGEVKSIEDWNRAKAILKGAM